MRNRAEAQKNDNEIEAISPAARVRHMGVWQAAGKQDQRQLAKMSCCS